MNDDRNTIKDIDRLEKEVSGALYVSQSTLNQAVNFIPAALLNFNKFLNITVSDSLRFPNENWDKYLKEELKNNGNVNTEEDIDELSFKQAESNNMEIIKSRLRPKIEQEDKVFWNITGGQRPFVGAVFQLIEELWNKTHYLAYLEGNTGKLIISKKEKCNSNKEKSTLEKLPNFDYSLSTDQMNINRALCLMGFNAKKVESTGRLRLQADNLFKDTEIKNFICHAKDTYFKDDGKINEAFRRALVQTNGKDSVEFEKVIKDHLPGEIQSMDFNQYHGDNRNKFGYLLEDMLAYIIRNDNELWNNILDMGSSVKLEFSKEEPNKEIDNVQIDEFDLLILNKYGQLINLECKSGGMSGDVAKSTNYSTYAIAGVYGIPVLISPMTQEEIEQAPKDQTEVYKHIRAAVKAAKKANLHVWGIDNVRRKLRPYLIPSENDKNNEEAGGK